MKKVTIVLAILGFISLAQAAIPTTGLQLHLDAGSLTGYSDGATVHTWPDLAGGDNNATSIGTPTYVADGLNGLPVIQIEGTSNRDGNGLPNSDDYFSFPEISNVKTIALVFKSTSNTYYTWSTILSGPTNDEYYWHGDTRWGTTYWDYGYTANSIAWSSLAIDGVGGYDGGYTAVDYDNFHVVTIDLYDGDQVDLAFLAHTARYNDYNVYGMDIAELLIYDQHLSETDLEQLQFELMFKYGFGATKLISPTNEQTNVPVNVELSWKAYDPAWAVDVYLDPNEILVNSGNVSAKLVSNEVLSQVELVDLELETTYFWRVDVYEPIGGGQYTVHQGSTWSFTTIPPSPFIRVQPVSITVESGDAVELSVTGDNIEFYQWYLNGSIVVGETGSTITLPSLTVAQEGVYTCEVSNSGSPDKVMSYPAVVVSERLVGWWKLDGDLTDSVDTVVAGALVHDGSISDPNFAADEEGPAYEFMGDGRIIDISDSSDYFNFYPQGLTVSALIKTSQTGWGGIVSKINTDNNAGYYMEHTGETWLVTGFRGIDGQWSSGAGIYDNWQLITFTLDGDSKTVKQYVNGALTVEAAYTIELPLSSDGLFFGAEQSDGTFSYDGLLKDVRIWSYPLDNVAVARLYTDMYGGEVCAEYPSLDVSGIDGTPDCVVNIYDLAVIAEQWLECNLVPTCIN